MNKLLILKVIARPIVRQGIVSVYSRSLEGYGQLAEKILEGEEAMKKAYPQLQIILNELEVSYELLTAQIKKHDITLESLVEELFPGLQREIQNFDNIVTYVKRRIANEYKIKGE